MRFDENGYLQSYKRREQVFQKEADGLGYSVLITLEKMSTDAIEKYRNKDAVEKMFRTMKTMLGMDTMRVHGEEAMERKSFLAFLSGIIWNEI